MEQIGDAADDPAAAAERQGIQDTCDALRKVLDLEIPATFIVIDPGGLSAFKPGEGVEVTEMEADAGAYDRSARAVAITRAAEAEGYEDINGGGGGGGEPGARGGGRRRRRRGRGRDERHRRVTTRDVRWTRVSIGRPFARLLLIK